MHRIYLEDGPISDVVGAASPHPRLVVTGEEARHAAKVKRIEPGERVEVLDGRGTVAQGRVLRAGPESGGRGGGREWVVEVEVETVTPAARVRPRVEVWSATPKGGRVDELIDGLSQVGAAAWRPLATQRGVVSPRETKLGRLQRVAWEAAKQCGRAWTLEIGEERPFAEALRARSGVAVVLADGAGAPYEPTGAAEVRLLIGPEGGWSDAELALAREAGVAVARFGPHAMRIETAAVVAAGIVLHREARPASAPEPAGGDEAAE